MKPQQVRKEIIVNASQETAFNVFLRKMNLWWPRSHHVGNTDMVEMVLEPKPKGRWYSAHEDGQQSLIGYVDSYEPFSRVMLVWQLDGEFKHNPNLITEVEVLFESQGPSQTLVKFEHRHLERIGNQEHGIDEGWELIMKIYRQLAEQGKLDGSNLADYNRRTMG
jgi:hypothetical protein